MNTRLQALDSLRGLAALTVVFSHVLLLFMPVYNCFYGRCDDSWVRVITRSPLHLFWAGHEAVIFFFVLSGFVLALPFLNKNAAISYRGYLVKRVCRIYLPYVVAVIIALILDVLFYRGSLVDLTPWFNGIGQWPISRGLVLQHFLALGSFKSGRYDPVLWSLVQEMRISLFFPLIVYCVVRFDWRKILLVAILISGIETLAQSNSPHWLGLPTDVLLTAHYSALFVVGAILAKYRVTLTRKVASLPRWSKYMVAGGAILAYTNVWWLLDAVPDPSVLSMPFQDWAICLGVVTFIMLALSSQKLDRILAAGAINFLGKISYSMYLYHVLVLFALVNMFHDIIPLWVISGIALPTVLLVAVVGYYSVEVPAMQLGRRLAERVAQWRKRTLQPELPPEPVA